ncbi:hypothetical protein OC834_005887 [Tilletia horrida]|nr:hypothetical protein OC834_005887 [Tilletia horrida]
MAATSEVNGPVPILASSLPHPLSQYAESIVPTFDHCGAMTNCLHRLDDVGSKLEDTSNRTTKHLQATHAKIRSELAEVVERLQQESSAHEARIKEESATHEARIRFQLDSIVDRVEASLSETQEYSQRCFEGLITDAKTCNAQVAQTVRVGQSAWMRMQAQLLAFNAWSVAWPEAIRVTGQDDGEDGQMDPPQYELRALRPGPSTMVQTSSAAQPAS